MNQEGGSNYQDLLDVDEVAAYLELDRPAVIDLANSGKIPATRRGENWTFERTKIDNWAATGRVK